MKSRFQFTLVLQDPCDGGSTVTQASYTDQAYTISDDAADYTIPVSTITPSFCPFDQVIDIANTSDGDNLLTESNGVITVDWISSLRPAGKTQVVTITVTTKTDYM